MNMKIIYHHKICMLVNAKRKYERERVMNGFNRMKEILRY